MELSPIQAALEARGATFRERDGASLPAHFGDVRAEHAALTDGAGILDLSAFPRYHLTGRDRVRYLHGLVTHDVNGLGTGQGRYATLMTGTGRTLCDLWIYAEEDRLLLVLPPGVREGVMRHLDFYLIADKAEFEDVSAASARLSVQGPGASAALGAVGAALPAEEHAWLATTVAGIPARIYREDRGGRGGFDLEVGVAEAPAVWDALVGAGARPAGFDALDVVRVEAGIPWTGHELTEKIIPMEAGLTAKAVSFHKGCYLGQEVLAKIKYRGKVNRLLTAFSVPEGAAPGDRLFFDGRDVGWLTSVVSSPTRGPMALGFLHRTALEAGGPVHLTDAADAPPLVVHALAEDSSD